MNFCGSYKQDDVNFLLKRIEIPPFYDVEQKEILIQSGNRHYSEMLTPESLPSQNYLTVFKNAYAANRQEMARDCLILASLIAERRNSNITLVSLVRAGTPIGVIVKNLLQKVMDRKVAHYSISIIRDRGIDEVALQYILDQGHTPESIVFIDGWTGKGVISRVLEKAITNFNLRKNIVIDNGLYVLSDLAGTAACAASYADYLIPSSILNSTVSGLISRSVLNESIGIDEFHGCVFYENFAAHDQSRDFAEGLIADGIALAKSHGIPKLIQSEQEKVAVISLEYLKATMEQHGIFDPNFVKPGIGEATRVLLRRVPRLLILRNAHATDVAHLRVLAAEKNVPILVDTSLPYQAVSLIRSSLDG